MDDESLERTSRASRIAFSRRKLLNSGVAAGLTGAAYALLPRYARGASVRRTSDGKAVVDLTISETPLQIGGRTGTATTINGTVPGPLLRLREGEETILRVTNQLREDTSIHWHGLLVPPEMDGVPGVSFPGIRPGQTFEYRFRLRQYGTYWYHSHSGLQEQLGHYGPILIEPAKGGHPYRYDREYVVVLSDWTFQNPYRVLARLKKQSDYYNFQRRTLFDFFSDVGRAGFMPTVRDRWMWARMRMNPTDIQDVTGAAYTFLMNGLAPEGNWTGLFRKGERVLLHFINAAADTTFDVRVPGLPMTLVQAQGQYVQEVETDEFRIAIAETYDFIVQPSEDRPYTIFAESMDRSGYARGTLAPHPGLQGGIPPRRKRPVLTMADMGMEHGSHGGSTAAAGQPGMQGGTGGHQSMSAPEGQQPAAAAGQHGSGHGSGHSQHGDGSHGGHAEPASMDAGTAKAAPRVATAGAIRTEGLRAAGTLPGAIEHEPRNHGPGNAMVPMMVRSRVAEPGVGLGADGWRVLVYTDLRALEKRPDFAPPSREIEIHLTGNMERFMWSIDGVPFAQSQPIRFAHGERLRLTMVNDTMMNHPMHLHGMWMELENGHREMIPRVHTVNVKPAEHLSVLITADAPGPWAFHCHVLYHMEVGMFRVVQVSPAPAQKATHEHQHGT